MPARTAWGAATLAVVALALYLYGGIDYLGEYAGADLRHYRAMAEAAPGLADDRPRPFAYRIGAPWLAGVTPLPDPLAFRLWTVLASLTLAGALYAYLLRLVRPRTAALTTVLFALNPYLFGFNAFDYFQLGDVLAHLVVLGSFWLLEERRWAALALVLGLGVCVREAAVLVVPVAFVWAAQQGALRRDGPALAGIAVLAVGAFVGLRLVVEARGGYGLVEALLEEGRKASRPATWFRLLVNAWAPLSLLPLVFLGTARDFLRERLHLVALFGCVLVSAFFGHDQERLMQPAFAAVYPLMAVLIDRHLRTLWVEGVLLGAGVLTSLHHVTARFPLPDRTTTAALHLAALALVTLAALAVRMGEGRAGALEAG